MQSKTLLAGCVAVVAMLAIVSGGLWFDLRSARQQIAELKNQQSQRKISIASSTSVPPPAPPPPAQTPAAPLVVTQLPESRPPPHFDALSYPTQRAMLASMPERPLDLLTLTRALVGKNPEERRLDALAQSDLAAKARVSAWSSELRLSPEQMQALSAIAAAELRRETEDSLQIMDGARTMDPAGDTRLREETATRQHETLLRIVENAAPHLTPEQSKMMRTMFAFWFEIRMTRIRLEERAALSSH